MLKYIYLLLATISLDQFSKQWIVSNLFYNKAIQLIKTKFFGLNLYLTYNTGIAFGLFNKSINGKENYIFSILTIITIMVMFYILYGLQLKYTNKVKNKATNNTIKIGILLIISGAIGNLIDRIIYHHVIDFIDLYIIINQQHFHWYVFNLADSLICIGTIILIYHELTCKLETKFRNEDENKKLNI